MKRYLLPCVCARRITVTAGQAGATVRCPDCGADVAVPRLGDIGRLEPLAAATSAAAARNWDAARACLLAGVITAVVALVAAGWLRGRRAGVAVLNEPGLRAFVETATADQAHQAWREFELSGIARQPAAEEQRRLAHAAALRGLETVAWIVAALGATAAAAAAVLAARPRRGQGRRPV